MSVESGRFDVLVLLCGGPKRADGGWRGNFETRMKVGAAAQAFRGQRDLGNEPDIISSGGAMWGAPPMGEVMARSLESPLYDVPRAKIIEENGSTDTGEQIRNIGAIVNERGYEKLGVIADTVHGPVAVSLFRNSGLDAELLPAEELLVRRDRRYEPVVERLHNSLYWKWWKFKYGRLSKELRKDPLLESRKARVAARVIRFTRTRFSWLRLPGTG
jgi:hypothetical protein